MCADIINSVTLVGACGTLMLSGLNIIFNSINSVRKRSCSSSCIGCCDTSYSTERDQEGTKPLDDPKPLDIPKQEEDIPDTK